MSLPKNVSSLSIHEGPKSAGTREMISVHNLVKKFGDVTAVADISFCVPEGQIFAFLGPNGAGKTTTIKILTTMLRCTEGSVRIDGLDVAVSQDKVRRCFGIVFQDSSLDDAMSAYENLSFHAVLYGLKGQRRYARIEEVLRRFDLWERRDEKVSKYSTGMRRRLEIARSLLHTPRILFLDEPSAGLDPQTRSYLWKQVKALNENEGVTVFLTTHYLEEAERVADYIAIIDHGKIVAQGTASNLKELTEMTTLDDAFVVLTGSSIRDG
ncbi:MAG TPA: ATP-binding cassette domain-containing protein [Candidatus Acidoferrales bacterium]|nr:ATP-binding cassette domain-containing protein [Candidatus Acidoferrales bacterium]